MEKVLIHKFETVQKGTATDIEDFFEKIVKAQFQNKEAILETHRALMKYIELHDAIFFVRLYGSFVKDKYNLLRRGFVSEFLDKKRIVFCDNTFSMLFTGLKIAGISYDEKQLKDFLKQKSVICSFGQTSLEKELSYYERTNAININLNSKGWYLAHIKPVGKCFGDLNESLKDIFPNPDREKWDINTKIRFVNDNLDNNALEILKAHFIRLIHPFNSFLLPKKSQVVYEGKNLGEEAELLKYVSDYLQQEFGEAFEEFNKVSMAYDHTSNKKDKIQNIEWSSSPIKNTTKKAKKSTIKKNEKTKNNSLELEEDLPLKLDSWLQSIGKEAFLDILYPELRNNLNVTIDEIANKHPLFKSYKIDSQKTRLSSSRSIFKYGMIENAMDILTLSNKKNISEKALKYLEELKN